MDLPNFVPGEGNPEAKLAIVGMAPGELENEARKPFIGPSGDLLWRMLSKCGIKRSDVYTTNVEKWMPPDNKLSRFKEIGRKPLQDIDLLRRELSGEACKPNAVLALGEHAFKALTGKKKILHQRGSVIQNWRGSIVESNLVPGLKVIGSYHTSALLRSKDEETKAFSASARAYMQNDFARAVQQSKFAELRLPKRQLEYAENADQFERFLDSYKSFKKVSIDIETTRGTCIPTCIGFAFNRHHGMSVPLLNVGRGVSIVPHEQVRLIKLVQSILGDEEIMLIGQNIKFDLRKLARPFAFNIRARTYHDVGMCNHILYPEFPKSLQFLTSTWTEEPYYKDELAEYDPDKQDFTVVLTYNAKDVCVPFEIHDKQREELDERGLTEFFYDRIMPLSDFYQAIEDRGLAFDPKVRDEIIARFIALRDELERNIEATIGYRLDIRSNRKVAKLIYEELDLPKRKDVKEPTLVQLIATQCKGDIAKQTILSDIIDIRKINRNLAGPLRSPPDYDGRMRTMFNINATVVGRTGNNLLKPPERPTELGQQFQNQSKHGEIGPEIRLMYHPDPGKIFLQIDMKQADARIVAALARDEWRLKVFELGKDIHEITASWYFDKENPLSDMDPFTISPDERFIGKATGHALAYFCQWMKLMLTINMYARRFGFSVTVTGAECKKFRSIFLAKSPKIEHVFWKEVLDVMKKTQTLTAASGRVRQFFGHWNPADFFPYIPAASVTDHNKFAAYRLSRKRKDLEILKEDHDSILLQCEEKELPEIAAMAKEEYEQPVDLSRCSLPRDPIIIPCDFEIGYNYKELKKWAVPTSA